MLLSLVQGSSGERGERGPNGAQGGQVIQEEKTNFELSFDSNDTRLLNGCKLFFIT
jgi:hypothetical protein